MVCVLLTLLAATACCDVDNDCGWAFMCSGECTNSRCSCSSDGDCRDGRTFDENGPITYCCDGGCTAQNPCPAPSPAPKSPGSNGSLSLPAWALPVGAAVIGIAAIAAIAFAIFKCRKNAVDKKATADLELAVTGHGSAAVNNHDSFYPSSAAQSGSAAKGAAIRESPAYAPPALSSHTRTEPTAGHRDVLCNSCKVPLQPGARFCPECGAAT